MSKFYVAYGSNLNKTQMSRRCPDAKVFGTGYLVNWELLYHGSKTGSYATIARKQGCKVPVAVWEISEDDEKALDRYEGFPRFYQKHNVFVKMGNGSKKLCMVYIMFSGSVPGEPSPAYIRTVRDGYWDFNLDQRYLDESIQKNRREVDEAEERFRPWERWK